MEIKGKFIDLLPDNLKNNEDIIAFAKIIDNEISEIDKQLDNLLVYKQLMNDKLPEHLVDKLATMFHLLPNESYRFADTVQKKRNLVKNSLQLHRTKGTKYSVERVLALLGFNGIVKEWFEDDYSTKGKGKPYHFKIYSETFDGMDPQIIGLLKEMISEFKNVRSHLDILEFNTVARGDVYYSVASLIQNDLECLPYFNNNVSLSAKFILSPITNQYTEISVYPYFEDVAFETEIGIAAVSNSYMEMNLLENE